MSPDDMPAGPELDRLVAEQVMGWTPALAANGKDIGLFNTGRPNVGNDDHQRWLFSFTPSTNIAHAWEVVERVFLARCEAFRLQWGEFFGAWRAGYGNSDVPLGIAPTAPLAICRAALKAAQ